MRILAMLGRLVSHEIASASLQRSFHALTHAGKRMRQMSIPQLNEDVMLKVLQVGQHLLGQTQHVSFAIDGTRLGSRDVNFVAVGGYCGSEGYRVAWAPVQVPHRSPGGLAAERPFRCRRAFLCRSKQLCPRTSPEKVSPGRAPRCVQGLLAPGGTAAV